ncbi:MAG: hypothetical protein FJW80_09245 [Actinobacteria bacterium]|nr:hypothetical protein [Actinomycetota bacterium]
MKDVMKPYLDMAAAVTAATVAKAVESAQAIISRNGPGSDVLDQAQIGSLGLVAVNLGEDQDFADDSGPEAPGGAAQVPGASPKGKGKGKAKRKGKAKGKGKGKAKGAAAEDAIGSDVLDQAQIGSLGLLSINLGGRQGFVDDQGAEIVKDLESEIASLRADVARLAEALVAVGVVELEHMAVLPRRRPGRSTAKRGAQKATAKRQPAKASAKKAPAKTSARKAPAKKSVRKASAKKSARKAPARRRRAEADD